MSKQVNTGELQRAIERALEKNGVHPGFGDSYRLDWESVSRAIVAGVMAYHEALTEADRDIYDED